MQFRRGDYLASPILDLEWMSRVALVAALKSLAGRAGSIHVFATLGAAQDQRGFVAPV